MSLNAAKTREDNDRRNQAWIATLFDACKREEQEDGGGLEQVAIYFLWRGGIRAKPFRSYKMAKEEFMQLYNECDVSVLPTIKNVYHPPESMNRSQLVRYATELRIVVEPFDIVTPEEDETVTSFYDNEEDLDLRNDILRILLSWERIIMTDPLPEHLQAMTPETFKCLSPATKRLVESRNGLVLQSAKKGSTMKTKKRWSTSS